MEAAENCPRLALSMAGHDVSMGSRGSSIRKLELTRWLHIPSMTAKHLPKRQSSWSEQRLTNAVAISTVTNNHLDRRRLTHDRSRRVKSAKDFGSRSDVDDTIEERHLLVSPESIHADQDGHRLPRDPNQCKPQQGHCQAVVTSVPVQSSSNLYQSACTHSAQKQNSA